MNSRAKNITVIISSEIHPINTWIEKWVEDRIDANVDIVRSPEEAIGGDICFLVSCIDIVSLKIRERFKKVLVIHASDLPIGRGWSPHIWEIINGGDEIVVSLLEASAKVDQGAIWKKLRHKIPKHALYKEVIEVVNNAHIDLMNFAVENFNNVVPLQQDPDVEPTYCPKRTPADSKISPHKSIAEQFNTLRMCDYKRFPAFFDLHGKRFKILIESYDEKNDY